MVSVTQQAPTRSVWHRLSIAAYLLLLAGVLYLIVAKSISLIAAWTHDSRPSINRILELGGRVQYEFVADRGKIKIRSEPPSAAYSRPVVRRVLSVYLPNPKSDGLIDIRRSMDFDDEFDGNFHVSDDDLVNLKAMKGLETLLVVGDKISDAGMENLRKKFRLETLVLCGGRITDRSIPIIAKMKKLKYLSLQGTGISDQALVPLGRLPNLQCLDVSGTKVTRAAAGRFRRNFPDCRLRH